MNLTPTVHRDGTVTIQGEAIGEVHNYGGGWEARDVQSTYVASTRLRSTAVAELLAWWKAAQ